MPETSGGVAVQQARSDLSTVLEDLLQTSRQHQRQINKLLWKIDNHLGIAEDEFAKLDRFIEREITFRQDESTGEWIIGRPKSRKQICKTCNGTGEFRFSEDELSSVICRECNGKGAGIVYEN